jgi:hypothetical protein
MAKTPQGVRGPGGPPRRPSSSGRAALERRSYPLLVSLTRVPRWLLVVFMAVCMVTGLMLDDSLAWLGALLLAVVAFFLGWLLALSWPIIGTNSRVLRLLTVVALLGIAVMKLIGRF